jgi:PhnB protein
MARNIPASWSDDEGRDRDQESAAALSICPTAVRPVAGREMYKKTMELNPCLNFSGQCAAAFKFYEQCLGGKIVMMQTHGETPAKDHVPADWRDKVIHARLVVGDRVLMGSDAPPPHYAALPGVQMSISVSTTAEGERVFKALAENGKITMPFQKTSWSSGIGVAVDRFGIPWMVTCDQTA